MTLHSLPLQVKAERDNALGRLNAAGAELLTASRNLEAQRRELDAFRRATFASYVAQHPPPPNYDSVITSRAVASPAPELQAPTSATVKEDTIISTPEPAQLLTVSPQPDSSASEIPSQVGTSPGLFAMPEPQVNPPRTWGSSTSFAKFGFLN